MDVGGTFRDFVLYEPGSHSLTSLKEPSTPEDPANAVRMGLEKLLERAGVAPQAIGSIVHGTTPGPNAPCSEPTITDCYVATGMLDPAAFLVGRIRLDAGAARRSLNDIARALGLAGPDAEVRAAEAALSATTAKMATELYKAMAQRSLDRGILRFACGGGAPIASPRCITVQQGEPHHGKFHNGGESKDGRVGMIPLSLPGLSHGCPAQSEPRRLQLPPGSGVADAVRCRDSNPVLTIDGLRQGCWVHGTVGIRPARSTACGLGLPGSRGPARCQGWTPMVTQR